MARIRTIKPSFFRSDDVSALPLRARLTWIGLWTQCDDQGRMKDHARLIKADVWPLDAVSLADIESDLETLAEHGRIARYEVDGQRYLEITNWREHQAIQKPTPSKIPPPSRNGRVVLPERGDSPTAGKGRERNGREGTRAREAEPGLNGHSPTDSEPPRNCEQHQGLGRAAPRCGPCADARRVRDEWLTAKRARIAAAEKCKVHAGDNLASNCSVCRSEELNPA